MIAFYFSIKLFDGYASDIENNNNCQQKSNRI